MAHEYVAVGDVKTTLNVQGESFADPDIGRALTAASRGIDKACNRRFWPDEDADQVRYYTARSRRMVRIDDIIEITEVATGSGNGTFATVLVENTDYTAEPLNAGADERPWTRLASDFHCFPACRRGVRITGKFGWASVPAEIEQATLILTVKLLKRAREAPFGVISFGHEGEVARIAKTDPDVGMLIGSFVRRFVH